MLRVDALSSAAPLAVERAEHLRNFSYDVVQDAFSVDGAVVLAEDREHSTSTMIGIHTALASVRSRTGHQGSPVYISNQGDIYAHPEFAAAAMQDPSLNEQATQVMSLVYGKFFRANCAAGSNTYGFNVDTYRSGNMVLGGPGSVELRPHAIIETAQAQKVVAYEFVGQPTLPRKIALYAGIGHIAQTLQQHS